MKCTTRKATEPEKATAAHALLDSIISLGCASTDDAHLRFELPPSVDQRIWGSVTVALVNGGFIHRVGELHTSRRVAHGRRIGLYVLACDLDAAIAERDLLAASAARLRKRDRQRLLQFAPETNETRH